MKKIFFVILFLSVLKYGHSQYDSILFQSAYRTYLIHIPPSYSGSSQYPLVIALHGGVSNAIQTQYVSKLSIKSNASNFIVVYPEGVKDPFGIRTWNGGGCCGYAVSSNIDDVGFIRSLIDSLRADYNIDTTRIYATGISNGAIMCYRLACELSNRIAAIAPVSGTLEDSLYTCSSSRPVPIIQFHSVLDSNIYMQGGIGQGISGYSFNPVNYGLQMFSTYNNCTQEPDSTHYFVGTTFYYKKKWSNCSCNTENIVYVTGDGGHSWPMGNQGLYQNADAPSQYIYANDTIWDFFQQNTLNCISTSVTYQQNDGFHISVFPIPAKDNIILHVHSPNSAAVAVTLYNSLGETVYDNKLFVGYTTEKEIITHNLPRGIYILKVTGNDDSKYIKIILQQ